MGEEELGMVIRYVTTYSGAGAEAAYRMDERVRTSVATTATAWTKGATVAAESAAKQVASVEKVALTVKEKADANIRKALDEKNAWRELAKEYANVARAAEKGSAQAREAYRLQADAAKRAGVRIAEAGKFGAAGWAAGARSEERTAGREARGLAAGSGALGGRALAFGSTAFLGGAIAGAGIKDIVDASKTLQTNQLLLRNTLKDTGIAWRANGAAIEENLKRTGEYSGFISSDLAQSYATLVRASRNVAEANKEEGVAVNVARARHIDLQTATKMVMLAQQGHVGLLRRLGVNITQVTTAEDALRNAHAKATPEVLRAAKAYDLQQTGLHAVDVLQKAYAGSARTYTSSAAGAADRYKVAIEELQVSLGRVLLPTITHATEHLTTWVEKITKSGTAQRNMNTLLGAAKTAFGVLRDVIHAADGVTGSFSHTVEVLLGIMAINKIRGIAGAITGSLIKNGILLVGPAAAEAEAESTVAFAGIGVSAEALSTTIKTALITTGIGALVVAVSVGAVEIINHWGTVKRWIIDFGSWISAHAYALLALPVIGQVAFMATEVIKHWRAIKAFVVGFAGDLVMLFTHPLRAIEDMFHRLEDAIIGIFKNIAGTVGGLLAKIPSWLPGMGKFHDWGVQLQQWAGGVGATAGQALGDSLAQATTAAMGSVQGLVTNPAATGFPGTGGGIPGTNVPVGAGTFQARGGGGTRYTGGLQGQALQQYIVTRARQLGVNPAVALAAASTEGGLSGAIGDQGTSFGPWQLHVGGALPAGLSGVRGAAFAQSKQGVDYVLQKLAGVTMGQGGLAAVTAVVNNFERPAAQYRAGEIANDYAAYQRYAGSLGSYTGRGPGSPTGLPPAVTQAVLDAQAANAAKAQKKAAAAAKAALAAANAAARKFIGNLNSIAAHTMAVAEAAFKRDHDTAALERAGASAVGDLQRAATYARQHGLATVGRDESTRATQLQARIADMVKAQIKAAHAAAVKAATAAINRSITGTGITEANALALPQQLQDTLTAAGIDPQGGAGLGLERALQDSVTQQLITVRAQLNKALQRAQRQGLSSLVNSLTKRLNTVQQEIAASTLAVAGLAQQAVQVAAAHALSSAQHVVTMAQGGLSILQLQQQQANGGDSTYTAAQLQAQAAYVTGTVLPAQQGLVSTLQGQLATAQAGHDITTTTTRPGNYANDALGRYLRNQATTTTTTHVVDQDLVNSILEQISTAQQDVNQSNVQAAQLIAQAAEASKQAAEDAASAVVQHAGHVANMAQAGYQTLQLQEQLAGTFDVSGADRAAYIRGQIIPALQGELTALTQQLSVATSQGDTSLAEQIAEAIVGKQNDVLQAQLDAQQATADNTSSLLDEVRQGSLGFGFGGEQWTDTLLGAGVGS